MKFDKNLVIILCEKKQREREREREREIIDILIKSRGIK